MSLPRYQAIRADLEARIQSGELAPGTQLPTEAELREQYGVSRATAQKALNELAQAGLAIRQRGRGTHVAEGARQVNLLLTLDPGIERSGIPQRKMVVSADVVPVSQARVDVPGLDDDAPVTQLVRVMYDRDDTPLVVEVTAIPFSLAPRLLEEDLENLTIRSYLASADMQIARSRMYFDPVLLAQPYADLLDVAGVPVLRRRRLMWQRSGDIAESTAYYLRPGAIDFYIEHVAE
jgi:GntR family transcriptional regulator